MLAATRAASGPRYQSAGLSRYWCAPPFARAVPAVAKSRTNARVAPAARNTVPIDDAIGVSPCRLGPGLRVVCRRGVPVIPTAQHGPRGDGLRLVGAELPGPGHPGLWRRPGAAAVIFGVTGGP